MAKTLYYDLIPVTDETPKAFITTAALKNCIVTGKTLDSMGGPGFAIDAEVIDLINMTKPGARSKIVVDAEEINELVVALEVAINADEPNLDEIRRISKALSNLV